MWENKKILEWLYWCLIHSNVLSFCYSSSGFQTTYWKMISSSFFLTMGMSQWQCGQYTTCDKLWVFQASLYAIVTEKGYQLFSEKINLLHHQGIFNMQQSISFSCQEHCCSASNLASAFCLILHLSFDTDHSSHSYLLFIQTQSVASPAY